MFSRGLKMNISKVTPLIPIVLSVILILWVIHLHDLEPVTQIQESQIVKEYCLAHGYPKITGSFVNGYQSHYCFKWVDGSSVVHKVPEEVYINIAK